MERKNFADVSLITAPRDVSEGTLIKFRIQIQEKYNVKIDSYWDLYKWSIENIPEFWAEIWNISGIIYSKPFDQVLDMTVKIIDRPEWFRGARLNIAENLLRFRDNHPALILVGEERQPETLTYAQLYNEANLYAAAFRKLGLKKGDRVACYMSNRKEPILAMIAATSIGAIFTGALPLIGAQAVLDRLKQIEPKVLITIDRFLFDGKEFEMLGNVEEIAKDLPTLEKVIVVPSNAESKQNDISKIRNSCFLDSFLFLGQNDDGTVPAMTFEQLPFSHPVFITYTSGTTGTSKAVVHGIGPLMSRTRDLNLHGDANRQFRTLYTSPVGWSSWNMSVMNLFTGMTTIQFEGSPFFLSPTYLWDLVDDLKINGLIVTPGILDDLEEKGYVPTDKHHLKYLFAIFVSASVVKLQNYDFVYKRVKRDILFRNIYGSSEVLGAVLSVDKTLPMYKGEISAPAFAMDVQCYNDEGVSVIGELGELVIRTPTPSLLLGLWNDEDGSIYRKTYFSKYKDVYAPGDLCIINPITNGFILCGRSDETLKPKGSRFGSSEIYNVVDIFPEILDSVCVSQYRQDMEERVVLFVKTRRDSDFDGQLVKRIRDTIERELTDEHVPEVVLQINDIPRNMNGKKMEILVKKIINAMPYNAETVINPECLKSYLNIPELSNY